MRFGRAAKGVSDARVVPQCCICDVRQEAPIVGERPLWGTRYYDRLWPRADRSSKVADRPEADIVCQKGFTPSRHRRRFRERRFATKDFGPRAIQSQGVIPSRNPRGHHRAEARAVHQQVRPDGEHRHDADQGQAIRTEAAPATSI